MTRMKGWLAATVLLGAALLAAVGAAFAASQTVSASVGPVAVPGVPLEVCVTADSPAAVDECEATPPAQYITLKVKVTAAEQAAVVPPTITPGSCPPDLTGAAAFVNTGSAGAIIDVSAVGSGSAGPFDVSPDTVSVPTPNKTVFVAACVN